MGKRLNQRFKQVLKWSIHIFLLLILPFCFAKDFLPRNEQIIPPKEYRTEIEMRGTELFRKMEPNVAVIENNEGSYYLYGTEKKEIEYIPLNKELAIPKGAISQVLHLPEEPVRYQRCYAVKRVNRETMNAGLRTFGLG